MFHFLLSKIGDYYLYFVVIDSEYICDEIIPLFHSKFTIQSQFVQENSLPCVGKQWSDTWCTIFLIIFK